MTETEAVEVIKANWPPANRTDLREALTIAVNHLEQSSNSDKTICPICGCENGSHNLDCNHPSCVNT